MGKVSTHHPPTGLGSVVAFPAGSGAEPRPKMDFVDINVRKKPSGTPSSVFLSGGGALAEPGKTSKNPNECCVFYRFLFLGFTV